MRKLFAAVAIITLVVFQIWFLSSIWNRQEVRNAPKPSQEQFIGQESTDQYDMANVELWYKVYNKRFFGDRLPHNVMFLWTDTHMYPPEQRLLGATHCTIGHTVCTVAIDRHYNVADVTMQLTLLHEMCHIQEWQPDAGADQHGPKWRACRAGLYSAHALDDLL